MLRVEISLNTKDLDEATRAAAGLTLASATRVSLPRDKMISVEDAKEVQVKIALVHSAKLDAVAANEIAYGADVASSGGHQTPPSQTKSAGYMMVATSTAMPDFAERVAASARASAFTPSSRDTGTTPLPVTAPTNAAHSAA